MNEHHDDDKYKKELLDLLRRVDKTLSTCGIEYFAVYGTCLGAVREKGIIPWDDDVDIAVRRCDFSRTLKVLTYSESQIYAGDRTNIPGCPARCGRIFNRVKPDSSLERRRAYIDLHIIDYAPTSNIWFMWLVLWYVGISRILERRQGKQYNNHRGLYTIADICALPFRLCSNHFLQRFADWLYKSELPSSYIKITFDGNRKRYPATAFSKTERVPFSGLSLPVPVGYDEYLTLCYGDWQTPPPLEGRYSHAYDRTGDKWTVPCPDDDMRQCISK